MRIHITGQPKIGTTKITRACVKYCASLLMTKRLTDTLTININFVKDIDHAKLGKKLAVAREAKAVTDYEDFDGYAPKEFTIEIMSNEITNPQKLIDVISHEMVHVEQFARKRMDYTEHDDIKQWEGKPFDMNKVSYWDYPWEIEAYGKEIGLASRFVETHAKKLGLILVQMGRPVVKES